MRNKSLESSWSLPPSPSTPHLLTSPLFRIVPRTQATWVSASGYHVALIKVVGWAAFSFGSLDGEEPLLSSLRLLTEFISASVFCSARGQPQLLGTTHSSLPHGSLHRKFTKVYFFEANRTVRVSVLTR